MSFQLIGNAIAANDFITVGRGCQYSRKFVTAGGDVILMGRKCHHSGQGMSVQCIWNVSTACSGYQYKTMECYYLG